MHTDGLAASVGDERHLSGLAQCGAECEGVGSPSCGAVRVRGGDRAVGTLDRCRSDLAMQVSGQHELGTSGLGDSRTS